VVGGAGVRVRGFGGMGGWGQSPRQNGQEGAADHAVRNHTVAAAATARLTLERGGRGCAVPSVARMNRVAPGRPARDPASAPLKSPARHRAAPPVDWMLRPAPPRDRSARARASLPRGATSAPVPPPADRSRPAPRAGCATRRTTVRTRPGRSVRPSRASARASPRAAAHSTARTPARSSPRAAWGSRGFGPGFRPAPARRPPQRGRSRRSSASCRGTLAIEVEHDTWVCQIRS